MGCTTLCFREPSQGSQVTAPGDTSGRSAALFSEQKDTLTIARQGS